MEERKVSSKWEVRRTHVLAFRDKPKGHVGRWCLADALGIAADDPRSIAVDEMVASMVERDASLRDIVQALGQREMTDAEYTAAVYSLGWFHCQVKGGDEDA